MNKYKAIHAVESLLLIVASLAATSVKAAPFARWLDVKTVQGQTVRVWAEGDEFAAHFETEDGYAVAFDQTRKVYVYVDKESDGSLVSTEVALGEEMSKRDRFSRLVRHLRDTSEKHRKAVRERMVREQVDTGLLERWRTRKAMRHSAAAKGGERSANGTVVGVTILIDFPVSDYDSSSYWDRQHPSVTATDIGDMLNGENFTKWGNASSVRSYYKDASCGHLDYLNVVLGPFKASRPRSYYNDSSVGAGYCAQVLISEIFTQMKGSAKWSTDYLPALQKASYEGKNILALNVLYAGPYPTVWSYGLWPHKSTLSSSVYSLLPISIDGDTKHLYTYEISPITQSPAIGTICHESGHMVCDFPDFYSYYHGSGCGAGDFSLMGGTTDDKNPEYFDPYLRAVAGWITPKPLPSSGTVTVAADLTDVWKYVNTSNPQEYYLIENRQKAGRDVGIPAAGVLIWRCDESSENYYADPLPAFANRTDGTQYRLENELSLEQADGTYAIERRVSIPGDSTDAWFAGNASDGYEASGGTFSDTTLPTAQWKDGSNSGLRLSRFSASSSSMTFLVGTGSSGEKPNLKPYQPTGWSAPVVISDDPDDMIGKTSFASGSELYLNWAFLNEGAATESKFWIRLYVDDEYEWDWYSEPPLNSGFYVHPSNPYLMNELSKGQHKITVVADEDGDINESDEDDNVYTVWVTVEGDLSTALDNDSLELWTDGDAEWFAQTAVTSDGEDAAQSGAIGNDGTSSLYTTVTGEGTISFFWNVSSENGWDNLAFFVDGVEMAKISGSPGWAKYTLEIKTSGTHDIEWRYSKDASAAAGQDCGWVDQVEWLPAGTPSVTVSFYANGGTLPSGASPKAYYVGSRYGDLPVPTMSDYSFSGWWTSSSGGSLVTADSVVSSSVTALYAHWTYVGGGGGGGGGGSVAGGRYALCVGLNEYSSSYIPSYNWLHQCVTDAESVKDMLVGSGDWGNDGVFKYMDAQGTRSAILSKLADFAAVAESGDQVVYFHSSHGGSSGGTDVYLCTYDGDLTDTDFANALLNFKQGVKLLIVIDACHSGGMFQAPRAGGSRAAMPEWNFAASVMEKYGRAQAASRGNSVPRLSGSDIAWITAANYDEYSYELNDGPGGAFTRAWTQGVIGGAADSEDLAGDGDGIVTAWEAAQYAGRAIANWSKVQCPYESASRVIVLAEVASATLGEALGEDYEWVTSAEDGDYSDGAWYSIGDLDDIGWFGEGAESLDGCAARSGAIIDYERASLRTSVSGEGTVFFKWKVSSEPNYDWLTFSVDGVVVGRISGTDGDWAEFTYVVPGDGSHELVWTYAKDVSGSEGEDCGWVDQFRWSCEGPVNPRQPPANDDFARAETVNGSSGTASGDSANATGESADPLPGRTVWWRWTAPADGMVTFCTKGSDFDTMLGVYAGSVFEDIQEVAEYNDDADDVDDFTSKLSFEAEAGVEYRILVTGYANAGGSIWLNWEMKGSPLPPLPENDDFADAKLLSGASGKVDATNVGATRETGEPVHAGVTSEKTVWWTWTPTSSAEVTFSTRGSDFDTVLAVYAGASLTRLTVIDSCDDCDDDLQWSQVAFTAVVGTTYCIVVGGYGDEAGSIVLNWESQNDPAPPDGVTFGSNQSSSFEVPDVGQAVLAGVGNLTWNRFDSTDSFGAPCFVDSRIVDAEKDAERNNDEFWCGAMTDMNMMFMQGWLTSDYSKVDDIVDRFAKNGESAIRWAESPATFDPTEDGDWDTFHEGEYGYGDEVYYTGMFRWLRDNETSASDILSHVTTGTVDEKFLSTLKNHLPDRILHLNVVFDAGNKHPFWGGCAVSHSVLCCGYVCDDASLGASALKGLFIVDSDNDQYAGSGGATAPNSISYCPVNWTGSGYSITGVWGETGMLEPQFVALGRKGDEPAEEFYTIRFEPGEDGTGTMDDLTVQRGKFVMLPTCEFSRVDRYFDGWYCPRTEKKYGDGSEVHDLAAADETVTLIAQWREMRKPSVYVVVFVSGEGETADSVERSVAVDTTFWLDECPFEGDGGREFAGWRCKETGVTYADRQEVLNLAAKGDSVTLIAQWRASKGGSYTIRFAPGEDGTGTMAPMQVETNTTVKLTQCAFVNKNPAVTFAQWKSDAGKTFRDEQEVRDLAKAGETVTLTAQWGCAPFPPVDDGLLEDEKKDVQIGFAAYVYDGYLLATNEDSSIAGVVTVKVDNKGKATATVTRIGVKKLSYKSQMPIAKGEVDLVCTKDPAPMHLTVYAGAIEGSCGAYQVKCRKNVAKENPAGYMAIEGKVWTVALKADELKAPDTMRGYASLTVTGAKKGKVKVSGLLPDGTKVSASAQASVRSDGVVTIPVVAQLYSGKIGGISLALRIDGKTGEAKVCGVGKWKSLSGDISWDASQSQCEPVNVFGITRTTDMFVLEEQPELIGGMNVATQFLHSVSNMMFMGKKWMIAKGGKIKLMGADFVDQAASPNPGGLTLSYTPKTGAFKGKYAVYVNNFGKSKKLSATINGVVVGESGYGTAVIKKQRSIPVRVEEQKK